MKNLIQNSKKYPEKLEEVSRRSDKKLEEVFKKTGEKFEVSKMINECSKNNKRFEKVSRTFDKVQKFLDGIEEKFKHLENLITKGVPAAQVPTADTDKNGVSPGPALKEEWIK
ncbi:hypothetical protein JTB14_012965 [Gonioctena quinquepunctata]|nr:hypothetical protein JTB14_012965 [Gonioctena quinquepunctata]